MELDLHCKITCVIARVPDTTLPSLCTTASGSTLTTVPYDQLVPNLSQSVNLTFCSTWERSSPFRHPCDIVYPKSPVRAMQISMMTTKTTTTLRSEQNRIERMFARMRKFLHSVGIIQASRWKWREEKDHFDVFENIEIGESGLVQ